MKRGKTMNKQAITFLSLFTFILVLSIYYIMLPQDDVTTVGNNDLNTIKELQIALDKKRDEIISKNNDLIAEESSTSDIINIKTKNIQYKKKNTDVDFKQFYFFIVFPKDNLDVSIQKGMFIFQNIGPYGIKTLITEKLQEFLSDIYSITLNCKTISPELFVKKVLNEKSIKQITMIKNYKSSDSLDNYNLGYGQEIKTLAKLNFKEPMWEKIKSSMLYVSGAKNRVFEFEDIKYDAVKVLVEIGGRMRKISLNNIENLSIIESIPDDIKTISGNPDKEKLIEYLKEVIKEYLEEMVLNFE